MFKFGAKAPVEVLLFLSKVTQKHFWHSACGYTSKAHCALRGYGALPRCETQLPSSSLPFEKGSRTGFPKLMTCRV